MVELVSDYAERFLGELTGCLKCGECCGPHPWSKPEEDRVREFLEARGQSLRKWCNIYDFACPYYEGSEKGCVIYPVRPFICRLFGHVRELTCENIKPEKYLSAKTEWKLLRMYDEELSLSESLTITKVGGKGNG